jgi:hypothetical protein
VLKDSVNIDVADRVSQLVQDAFGNAPSDMQVTFLDIAYGLIDIAARVISTHSPKVSPDNIAELTDDFELAIHYYQEGGRDEPQ